MKNQASDNQSSMRNNVAWALMIWLGLQAAGNSLAVQDASFEFSCAAFPPDLSEAGLRARYGKEYVRAASVFGSDDGPQDGTARGSYVPGETVASRARTRMVAGSASAFCLFLTKRQIRCWPSRYYADESFLRVIRRCRR
jgi:hypothetical protein